MSSVVDSVGSLVGSESEGSKAARHAMERQMDWQQKALDYMMESDELPQELRQQAMSMLGGLYGLEGGEGSQQMLIDQARESPLYGSIMGGQKAGEESIMRNAAATGGLRSGNVQANMYDFNVNLQNRALLESYNQQLSGLSGLAKLPSNAQNIAGQYNTMGQTYAQGRVGYGQAQAAAQEQGMEYLQSGFGFFGGGGMGGMGGGMPSI
jgi:hypothetical protein